MAYSLGHYLYWWSISTQLSVLTWFIHLVVTSTGDLLVPSCLYWHGLFTWSLSLLVVYYSPVFCTDMVYSLGRYFYWWSISPQLSVLTWFIHLDVTSAGGLLFPSMLYRHGLFTWSLPLLVVYSSPVVCTDMVYSLGRSLYWWPISPHLSVLTWFIHLDVISTGGLLFPSFLYWHGLFTWTLSLLVVYYSQVFCTDMVYSLGRYLYWWSISPQLSVLIWFIHLFVTSAGGLLFPSNLYWHGLFTWSLPLLVVY